jgi:hypothetical protein
MTMKNNLVYLQDDLDEGKDKPVVVRYYGDAKKEAINKYRKSPVKIESPVGKCGNKTKQ